MSSSTTNTSDLLLNLKAYQGDDIVKKPIGDPVTLTIDMDSDFRKELVRDILISKVYPIEGTGDSLYISIFTSHLLYLAPKGRFVQKVKSWITELSKVEEDISKYAKRVQINGKSPWEDYFGSFIDLLQALSVLKDVTADKVVEVINANGTGWVKSLRLFLAICIIDHEDDYYNTFKHQQYIKFITPPHQTDTKKIMDVCLDFEVLPKNSTSSSFTPIYALARMLDIDIDMLSYLGGDLKIDTFTSGGVKKSLDVHELVNVRVLETFQGHWDIAIRSELGKDVVNNLKRANKESEEAEQAAAIALIQGKGKKMRMD